MKKFYFSSPLPAERVYANQTAILLWLKSLGHSVEFARDYDDGRRPSSTRTQQFKPLRCPPPKPDPAKPNLTSELSEYVGTRCPYCGDVMTADGMTRPSRDHKHPRSKGGTLSRRNKIVVCRHCNEDKDARTVEEWHEWLIARADPRVEKVGWILFDEIKGRGLQEEA
jgi:5-methylcytosine-specific restriction endonuclease McrA